jgi:hypothetical protein
MATFFAEWEDVDSLWCEHRTGQVLQMVRRVVPSCGLISQHMIDRKEHLERCRGDFRQRRWDELGTGQQGGIQYKTWMYCKVSNLMGQIRIQLDYLGFGLLGWNSGNGQEWKGRAYLADVRRRRMSRRRRAAALAQPSPPGKKGEGDKLEGSERWEKKGGLLWASPVPETLREIEQPKTN